MTAQTRILLKTTAGMTMTGFVIGLVCSAVPLALAQFLWHSIRTAGVTPVGFFGAIWIWGGLWKPRGITSAGFMTLAFPNTKFNMIVMLMLADRCGVFAGSVIGSGLALGAAGASWDT